MAARRKPIGVDFFCGCGGMTAGLTRAGVEVRLGIDIDPICRKTYERNTGVRFECRDIRKLSYRRVERALRSNGGKRPLLFAACAPCQPFSKVRKSGRKRGNDSELLLEFLRFVLHFRPEYVISENVPCLQSSGRRIIRKFIKSLREAGYRTDFRVVNAADFGVPQHRLRLVILASRAVTDVRIPEGPTRKSRPTVYGAIGNLPAIGAGARVSRPPNHWASGLSPKNLQRIRAVPTDGGDLRSVPASLRPPSRRADGRRWKGAFFDVYGRMKWDAPAPTLTTRCNSYSNGRYGHPEQDRAISLREAAALQSFPASYVFSVSSIGDGARLIGNAVPVRLAFHLAKVLLKPDDRVPPRVLGVRGLSVLRRARRRQSS